MKRIGYICKECGDVAPYGIGYVSDEPAAVQRSPHTNRCACGHSVRRDPTAPVVAHVWHVHRLANDRNGNPRFRITGEAPDPSTQYREAPMRFYVWYTAPSAQVNHIIAGNSARYKGQDVVMTLDEAHRITGLEIIE